MFVKQSIRYDFPKGMTERLMHACYDILWTPKFDFNGCNVVQDKDHPCAACFLHDYDWIVNGGGNKYDVYFRQNLIMTGHSKPVAWAMYFGVRIGWMFYYKWRMR